MVKAASSTCAAVIIGVLSSAIPAHAGDQLIPVPENGVPGYLRLSSSIYPLEFPPLAPGDSYVWQIALSLHETEATSTLQIVATGGLAAAGGYELAVDECPSMWQGDSGLNQSLSCAVAPIPRVLTTELGDINQDVRIPISNLRRGTSPYLRFTLASPASTAFVSEPTFTLGIGISAMGADGTGRETPQPSAVGGDNNVPLGNTGAAALPAFFAGCALLLLGLAAVALTNRSRSSTRESGA